MKNIGVSGSFLKCLAMLCMLIDHVARFVFVRMDWASVVFFKVGHTVVNPLYIMVSIGRLAFPIFAFLMVEGFLHTHDRKKYGRNLLFFALLSEIPWNLVLRHSFFCPTQNVIFTLFLGFLALHCIEKYKDDRRKLTFYMLALLLASLVLRADYGMRGFGFIVMLYLLRNQPLFRAVTGACFLSSTWRAGLAFIPISLYNGKRGFIKGKYQKYLFYLFYPVHLLVIYLCS